MLRSTLTASQRLLAAAGRSSSATNAAAVMSTSASTPTGGVSPRDMPYFHHGIRPRYPSPKFKSPRKRASKLFDELQKEAVQTNTQKNPSVLNTKFRVGDAIELEVVATGGVNGADVDKIRGVVLGRTNRGLGSSVLIRDVVFGEPVERKIPLHSPLLKSLKVLEKNFVFKGKRKVKRAKLYYLRDRLPQETRVTKW